MDHPVNTKISRRNLLLAASVAALAGALAPQGAAAQERTRLVVGTTADVVNFNPLVGNSKTDTWVNNLMYPRLMMLDADGNKKPNLATEWGYSDDGLAAWLEIRGDMKWSDGVPLTAKDVAYTINAIVAEKIGLNAGLASAMVEARAVSPTRVEFTLSRPDGVFLSNIGFWMPVVPSHVFPETGVKDFANDKDWVSAGPFRLTGFDRGQRYLLERTETYPIAPNGQANVQQVEFRVFPDVNAQALALRAGDLDLIANAIPPAIARTLKADPKIALVDLPALGWAHMQYNLDREHLKELPVRQALAKAVDYEAIRRIALQGMAGSTNSSVISPVLSYWFDPSIEEYRYDPEGARKILEEAGYKDADGDGFYDGLTFSILYDQAAAEIANWVQIVRDSSAKAGIKIELTGLERNTYLARSRARDFDIYTGAWSVMEEPAGYVGLAFKTGGFINYANVADPEVDAAIEKAQTALTPEAALGPVHEVARLVHAKVYDNVLYYQNFQFAYNQDRWDGFVPLPSDLLSLINPLSLASAKAK